ncbi:MAG: signal peptide peptidase SppA [Phycisphaerae bacterium]|nr:signal peptide peptidase SppA [Phycisphaerae bacterium]
MPSKVLSILLGAVFVGAGCHRPSGWVVKPVRIEERLTETVIATDPGLFVGDKIVVVDLDGLIVNQRPRGLLGPGENPVSFFVEKLDKAAADANVRAVVVRINSPGGGVTASDIMHRRLVQLRTRRRIPVVAILQDVGASGAYYVACAADKIMAHPTSVTGSIGVMIQTLSLAGTMKMLGIEARAVTSGPRKDLASPLKPLDEKDAAILREMVEIYHQRFIDIVTKSRTALAAEQIKKLADGRVYTGDQAADNGLIDAVGYMDDAIDTAKKLASVTRAKVVIYHRPMGYRPNAYAAAPSVPPQMNMLNISLGELTKFSHPQFLYLWTGKRFSH